MITVFETAIVPQVPSEPRVMLNILLGLVAGLAGGFGLVFLFENLDTILYTTDDIEAVTKLSALAKIPEANKNELFIFQNTFSPIAEAFRNLATYVQQIDHGRPVKVLLVLSAEPDQGKSLIVSQLALCLAESGRRVVVVDCDMRLPTLHRLFMISNQCGLTDVLERRASLENALQQSYNHAYHGVQVLSSGTLPAYPSKLLASPEMTELINRLAQKFDYVLLDTPAMLGIADVAAIIQKVDGFLWVVKRTHARREAVEAARKILAGFSEKSMGLIVNQADQDGSYRYYREQQKSDLLRSSTDQEVVSFPNVT
jgi:capsular exopolysaccharide synthesis family protein